MESIYIHRILCLSTQKHRSAQHRSRSRSLWRLSPSSTSSPRRWRGKCRRTRCQLSVPTLKALCRSSTTEALARLTSLMDARAQVSLCLHVPQINASKTNNTKGIFVFFVDAACQAAHRVFGLPRVSKLRHRMMAELDSKKQRFLMNHHHVDLLIADICDLKKRTVTDVRRPDLPVVPPSTALYGAGISCKDIVLFFACKLSQAKTLLLVWPAVLSQA